MKRQVYYPPRRHLDPTTGMQQDISSVSIGGAM